MLDWNNNLMIRESVWLIHSAVMRTSLRMSVFRRIAFLQNEQQRAHLGNSGKKGKGQALVENPCRSTMCPGR